MKTVGHGIERRAGPTQRAGIMAMLALALLLAAALFTASPAGAGARPGMPTARSPAGAVDTQRPAFTWSKAARATSYELRAYQGAKLLVKKTGVKQRSWRSTRDLPRGVALTWKVRGRNNAGSGPWSRSARFQVKVAALAIGDPYQGGIIAYIVPPGDPRYVAGETHGLIAAAADQTSVEYGIEYPTMAWSNITRSAVGVTSPAFGAGQANTTAIVGQVVGPETCTRGAALVCDSLVLGGYSDWYLPSKGELGQLWVHRVAIGGFSLMSQYWSSSEFDATPTDPLYYAWKQYFGDGSQAWGGKDLRYHVRAVRSF